MLVSRLINRRSGAVSFSVATASPQGQAKSTGLGISPFTDSANSTYLLASRMHLSRSAGSPGCGRIWSTPRPSITSPQRNKLTTRSTVHRLRGRAEAAGPGGTRPTTAFRGPRGGAQSLYLAGGDGDEGCCRRSAGHPVPASGRTGAHGRDRRGARKGWGPSLRGQVGRRNRHRRDHSRTRRARGTPHRRHLECAAGPGVATFPATLSPTAALYGRRGSPQPTA